METNTTQSPVTTPSVSPITEPVKSKTPILMIILGILVFLLAIASGFLFIQNMNLQDEIKGLKASSSYMNIVSPAPIPSVVPTTSSSYVNTQYNYTFEYPQTVKVTDKDYNTATSTSEIVLAYVSGDQEGMYSGITIEYVGMVEDFTRFQKTMVNGIDVYSLDSTHGVSYYVNIPDTDTFLHITGAGGLSSNIENNQIYKQIFSTFKFTN